MWLSILIIVAIVGGGALAIAGTGPIGLVFVVIGIVALGARLLGGLGQAGRTSNEPETVPGGHKRTGHAHAGQEHMTP